MLHDLFSIQNMQFRNLTIYMTKLWIAITFLIVFCLTSLADSKKGSGENDIFRLNQIGFYPSGEKVAIVKAEYSGKDFCIRTVDTREIVYSGKISNPHKSDFSDKKTAVLTFTELDQPGEYVIEIPEIGCSHPFNIKKEVLSGLATASLKAFYFQRSGTPIPGAYAGNWSRPVAHTDTAIMIHSSAASESRPESSLISSPKGWYDAGDYNKYIVNSGFTVGVLLSLYEDYPAVVENIKTLIPESRNSTPDLLDEVYWNLDWMLTMQDPEDGGVYHKLTTPGFEGFIKPADCKKQRYVTAKSVTATLDFAASMAQASRVFASFETDYPGAAAIMLQASRRAFDWALKYPGAFYNQNEINRHYSPPISTGEYGDGSANDEFFWAATELYITTGDEKYLTISTEFAPEQFRLPVWSNVDGLGCLTLVRHEKALKDKGRGLAGKVKDQLLLYAENAIHDYNQSSYAAPYGQKARDFFWGCNSDGASNQGITFLYAWQLTKDKKYLMAALHNMDYLMGRNATGFNYVTGFGYKSPQNPHHRISASDNIEAPVPGLLVGGPNPGKQDKCDYLSDIPDECYTDAEASYASNEIAINWQGMFAYFSTALNACMH